jgi:PleD family two-component response regulator
MLANYHPSLLLASPDPVLLAAVEPELLASGARVKVVLTAQAVPDAMSAPNPPDLVLLDGSLPGLPFGQLLVMLRADHAATSLPIVLITEVVTEEALVRISEGVVDDLILRSSPPGYWRLRVDQVFRLRRTILELELLRESTLTSAQMDRLTGVYNREALLSMLFREFAPWNPGMR